MALKKPELYSPLWSSCDELGDGTKMAERYENPLPKLTDRVAELEVTVNRHLERMEFLW